MFKIVEQKDYFLELVDKHLAGKKYTEATNIIVHLNFLDKFDLMELCINLSEDKKTNLIKKILDK